MDVAGRVEVQEVPSTQQKIFVTFDLSKVRQRLHNGS